MSIVNIGGERYRFWHGRPNSQRLQLPAKTKRAIVKSNSLANFVVDFLLPTLQ